MRGRLKAKTIVEQYYSDLLDEAVVVIEMLCRDIDDVDLCHRPQYAIDFLVKAEEGE